MWPRQASMLGWWIFLLQMAHGVKGGLPCNRKYFGRDSIVCVCNSTYCDTHDPVALPPVDFFVKYESSKSGKRLAQSQGKFQDRSFVPDVVLTLEPMERYQIVKGFGGSVTDSASINILSLTPDTQNNLLRSYFSEDGIEYNMIRVPMASCDFSMRQYTYADWPNDYELKYFSLADEDIKLKIPLIHRVKAMSKKPVSLFASPWTAPIWMKTNNDWKGKGSLKGEAGNKVHKTWANYFIRFLDEYAKRNLTFWGLTAQNEPTAGLIFNYPFQCLGFTPEQQRDFIALDLGPALEKSAYKDIRLMILDDNRVNLPHWAKVVLSEDSEAHRYIHGIGLHWYLDFIAPIDDTVDITHHMFPDYFLLSTEACAGAQFWERDVILGDWNRGDQYSRSVLTNLNHNVIGWVDWNLALDLEGGPNLVKNYVDSPIIVDVASDSFYKQPMFYHLAHFSKFIPEGSQRIGLSKVQKCGSCNLEHVALIRPDGAAVVVVLNRSAKSISFGLSDTVGMIVTEIPPNSIQTYLWRRE